jgi:hypothetical protein
VWTIDAVRAITIERVMPLVTAACLLLSSCGSLQDSARQQFQLGKQSFKSHNYKEAEMYVIKSVELSRNDKKQERQLIQSLLFLSRIFMEQAKYTSAEESLLSAVEAVEETDGRESRLAASTYLQLAAC